MEERKVSSRGHVVETRDIPVIYMSRDADGLGGRMPVRFTRKVAFVAECEAVLDFMHGGKSLKESSKFCDWYGWTDAVTEAISEAAARAADYGITAQSTLVLEVRASVKLTPVLAGTDEAHFGRKRWTLVPQGWHVDGEGADVAIAEWLDGRRAWEEVPAKVESLAAGPVSDVLAWSSANDGSANDALLAAFIDLANAAAPGAFAKVA